MCTNINLGALYYNAALIHIFQFYFTSARRDKRIRSLPLIGVYREVSPGGNRSDKWHYIRMKNENCWGSPSVWKSWVLCMIMKKFVICSGGRGVVMEISGKPKQYNHAPPPLPSFYTPLPTYILWKQFVQYSPPEIFSSYFIFTSLSFPRVIEIGLICRRMWSWPGTDYTKTGSGTESA